MSALPVVAVSAAALVAARWWYPRAVERASAARLPVGGDGIILGAHPRSLPGTGERGVLVLHGFGDTPQSVDTLGRAFHARGYTVHVPLLAGHGRTLRAFARSGGDAWMTSAREALGRLSGECAHVSLVGQSLGGALATLLAAESPAIRALALLAPYLDVPPAVRRIAPLMSELEFALPYLITRDQRSILDDEARARSLSFGATTPRLTKELIAVADRARRALPAVRAPTLYLQAGADNRIAPGVAERGFFTLGAAAKQLIWLEDSGHVLAADRSRDRVAALVTAWCDER